MYQARVFKVMIATPGDVAAVRQVVREAVHRWNALLADDHKVVLLPVGWETHAHPMMGDRPQAVINKQVLKDCDLLVAVFWTRLGSPTGEAASGTVEEIEEHLKAGKPAMIYFSNAPVRPDSIDEGQYRALREFRTYCEARGLIETFESPSELQDKFGRQLIQLVLDRWAGAGNDAAAEEREAVWRWEAGTPSDAVRARWSTTCAGRPFGRSSARACRDRSPCRSLGTRQSRSIAATLSWMRPCNGKRQHASMPGWLSLRQHHRRPPLLRSVKVIDAGAASRGESGHPTPAGRD